MLRSPPTRRSTVERTESGCNDGLDQAIAAQSLFHQMKGFRNAAAFRREPAASDCAPYIFEERVLGTGELCGHVGVSRTCMLN